MDQDKQEMSEEGSSAPCGKSFLCTRYYLMDRTQPIEEQISIQVVGSEARERNSFYAKDEKVATLMKAAEVRIPQAKIQKVIFLLRDHKEFKKYFEPRVASLGPIHHGNPKYVLGEKYKLRLAHEYVKNCDNIGVISPRQINTLYQKIMENIGLLREHFEEEVVKEYDDDDLAWMLLVDGCAILQYISTVVEDRFSELNIKNDSVAFANQDLFLLENQVPYLLLKLLMSLSEKKATLEKSIEDFIGNETLQQTGKPEPVEPTHLLDLLRTRLFGNKKSNTSSGKNSKKKHPYWQSFRNVQELRAAGIHVRRGKSSNLQDISFTRGRCCLSGYLWLPEIKVDDSTAPKFMNLIAYEMCLDFHNDFGITSYISLLDSLIDEPNDVKQLRKARVLHSFLGSDEQVANLFNELGTDLVPNIKAYADVKCEIQDYYDNKWSLYINKCMNLLRRDYLRSPWSAVAILVASSLLFLTATQTWFAVWPHKQG